jgi:hypothetical protein
MVFFAVTVTLKRQKSLSQRNKRRQIDALYVTKSLLIMKTRISPGGNGKWNLGLCFVKHVLRKKKLPTIRR